MNLLSLQKRIALILIGSMLAVLVIAMGIAFVVVSQSEEDESIASAAEFLVALDGVAALPEGPPLGMLLTEPTQKLQQELAKRGAAGTARVTEELLTQRRVAAYQLSNGRWATIDVPKNPPPPRAAWLILTTWLTVTVLGVGSVALVIARRVTEPFAILDRAVATVGPSGELPQVPVTGSAESRRVRSAINNLAVRLKSAMQSRMRLVAAAGHDLRTPITRMRLRAELLPEAEQAEWLADMDELEQIAESAIGLVREESGASDLTNIEMSSLVEETVNELAASDLPVELGTVEPAVVRAAPLSLRRALRNLITNAATYGGGATVSLGQLGETVFVQIEDNGPGIPEEMLAQVFEPFFRADPSRGNTKGAGLGLTIANEIIERLGGSLTLENRPSGGLLQVVALPSAV